MILKVEDVLIQINYCLLIAVVIQMLQHAFNLSKDNVHGLIKLVLIIAVVILFHFNFVNHINLIKQNIHKVSIV